MGKGLAQEGWRWSISLRNIHEHRPLLCFQSEIVSTKKLVDLLLGTMSQWKHI